MQEVLWINWTSDKPCAQNTEENQDKQVQKKKKKLKIYSTKINLNKSREEVFTMVKISMLIHIMIINSYAETSGRGHNGEKDRNGWNTPKEESR